MSEVVRHRMRVLVRAMNALGMEAIYEDNTGGNVPCITVPFGEGHHMLIGMDSASVYDAAHDDHEAAYKGLEEVCSVVFKAGEKCLVCDEPTDDAFCSDDCWASPAGQDIRARLGEEDDFFRS